MNKFMILQSQVKKKAIVRTTSLRKNLIVALMKGYSPNLFYEKIDL